MYSLFPNCNKKALQSMNSIHADFLKYTFLFLHNGIKHMPHILTLIAESAYIYDNITSQTMCCKPNKTAQY